MSTRLVPARTAAPSNCSPRPCAVPNGFGIYVTALQTQNGLLTMQVRFHNGTRAQTGEATSLRHTSPADFFLIVRDGGRERPLFNDQCPDWPELKVARGADAGPEPICFKAPQPGQQVSLGWSPDLGVFFDEVDIPLQ